MSQVNYKQELLPRVRRAAAWGLVALLIAVFPANIYMATNPVEAGAASLPHPALYGRLLLQPAGNGSCRHV